MNNVKRVGYAVLLSLVAIWLIGIHTSWTAAAADPNTAILAQLQAGFSALNGKMAALDAKVTTMSDQQRAEQFAVRRRLNDVEQKAIDLANGMADLDAARQNQTVISLAQRMTSVETKLDQAREQAKKDGEDKAKLDKENHDATMAWLRPSVFSIFATFLSVVGALIVAHLKDKREKLEKRRADASVGAAGAVQDSRLDAIERDQSPFD